MRLNSTYQMMVQKTGLSISGLARLCGGDRTTVRDLVNSTEGGGKTPPKWLESLIGKVFVPGVKGSNNAKVIDAKAASRIIRYYAYESAASNETAKDSYDKFAEIGVETWVKEITGYASSNDMPELKSLIYKLIDKVDKLEVTTNKYNSIKQTTVRLYPGIDYINSEIEDGYLLEPTVEDVPFTASEWLLTKGITLERSAKHKFALLGKRYSTGVRN